jgi:hypothetical protein
MLSVLAFLILLYLKRTGMYKLTWTTISLPLYIVIITLGIKVYQHYLKLKDSPHFNMYKLLTAHLIFAIFCLFLAIHGLTTYLDLKYQSLLSLFLRLMPLYLILVSSFCIFLYILPGMLDPEIQADRRVPFTIFLYFITAFVTVAFVNFEGI